MKCIMLSSILKKYPKLFLVYFTYMLLLFIFLSVFALYVIRFSDFRFLSKDFDVIESAIYTVRDINDNIYSDKDKGQYEELSYYLDNSRIKVNDHKAQFELVSENKYRVCLRLNTDYNFRKDYKLTLDNIINYRNYRFYSSKAKIYFEKISGEQGKYYECYVVEV